MELYNSQPTIVAMISELKKTKLTNAVCEQQLEKVIAARFEPGQPGITRCINDLRKITNRLKKAEALKQQLIEDMSRWTRKHEIKPEDLENQLGSPLLTRSGRRNTW
jgi:ABC-type hemin transport system substrate-binding protein